MQQSADGGKRKLSVREISHVRTYRPPNHATHQKEAEEGKKKEEGKGMPSTYTPVAKGSPVHSNTLTRGHMSSLRGCDDLGGLSSGEAKGKCRRALCFNELPWGRASKCPGLKPGVRVIEEEQMTRHSCRSNMPAPSCSSSSTTIPMDITAGIWGGVDESNTSAFREYPSPTPRSLLCNDKYVLVVANRQRRNRM